MYQGLIPANARHGWSARFALSLAPAAQFPTLFFCLEARLPGLQPMDAHDAIVVTVSSNGLVHDRWDEPLVGALD